MPLVKNVAVTLDKERHFRLTLNSMVKFEEVTGKSLLSGLDTSTLTSADLRALMWACLIHEDKELSLDVVGDMIDMGNVADIQQALTRALSNSMPVNTDDGDPNPQSLPTG